MKFIIGNRCSGVTTDMLLEANKFNRPIIVPTEAMKDSIEQKCTELKIHCPEIYSFMNVRNGALRKQKIETIYISDIDLFLKMILKEYGYYGEIGTVGISLEQIK